MIRHMVPVSVIRLGASHMGSAFTMTAAVGEEHGRGLSAG